VVAVVVLAACGGAPAPAPEVPAPPVAPVAQVAPPPVVVAPPAPPPPSCVDPSLSFDSATARDGAVDACFRIERDAAQGLYTSQCWTFDLGSNAWAFEDSHDLPPDSAAGSGSDSGSAAAADPATAHVVRADGAYAADWDDTTVKVTDKAGKPVRTFKGWHTDGMSEPGKPSGIRAAKFVDDTLAIYVASTPISDAVRLYDPRTGKQLGAVNPDNGLFEDDPTPLGNHQFAFIEMPALSMFVIDVATGRKLAVHKLNDLDHPGSTPVLVKQYPDTSFVVVEERQAIRVDPAGAITHVAAPECPAK
jgi:hypothetical protein